MNRRKILSNSEISAFCGQLSLIVKAGISLQEGLLIMAEDDKNGRGGEIIEKLTDVMEAGGSFAAALKESGEFPGYMVTMVARRPVSWKRCWSPCGLTMSGTTRFPGASEAL